MQNDRLGLNLQIFEVLVEVLRASDCVEKWAERPKLRPTIALWPGSNCTLLGIFGWNRLRKGLSSLTYAEGITQLEARQDIKDQKS